MSKKKIGLISISIVIFIIVVISVPSRNNMVEMSEIQEYAETLKKPSVTQQDLRIMIDEWMNNPIGDGMEQRLEIMKAFYTFQESGQKLTDDQAGRVMYNQIVKMVSFDIPKEELDQMKQDIRDQLEN